MVIIALVMALTMVIGSANAVSAAAPPKGYITITDGVEGVVWLEYGWKHLGVDTYYLYLYESGNPGSMIYASGNYLGPDGVVNRNYDIPLGSINDVDIDVGGDYTALLVLYGKKGTEIATFISNLYTVPVTP